MKNLLHEEIFPIVDEQGKTIGEAPRSLCHDGKSFLLHPVVHLHLFNTAGKLYLQKRAAIKDIHPGKWDISVGGHVSPGESVTEALTREAYEELGLEICSAEFLKRYIFESPQERELVNSFYTVMDVLPVIEKDEIEDGKYWSLQEIKESIGNGIFTPNFENEFEMFFSSSNFSLP